MEAIILAWLVVILVAWPFGLWITGGLKKRYPEEKEIWWGLEVFPLAFAVAPMAVSGGYVGFIFPASWGILIALVAPSAMTSKDTAVAFNCVISVLITWGVLWLLRGFCGWFIHRPASEKSTGRNDVEQHW